MLPCAQTKLPPQWWRGSPAWSHPQALWKPECRILLHDYKWRIAKAKKDYLFILSFLSICKAKFCLSYGTACEGWCTWTGCWSRVPRYCKVDVGFLCKETFPKLHVMCKYLRDRRFTTAQQHSENMLIGSENYRIARVGKDLKIIKSNHKEVIWALWIKNPLMLILRVSDKSYSIML